MHELRDYQKRCCNAVVKHLNSEKTPCVLDASVGAGKSLMIAKLSEYHNSKNMRVLVLAHTSDLVEQNHNEFDTGHTSICCSDLGKKNTGGMTVYASEKTIWNMKKLPEFDVVLVDECDRVNDQSEDSIYMKLFSRIGINKLYVGFTGTPFRLGTGVIYGNKRFFKKVVGQITTGELIENGYLVPPVLPSASVNGYDFGNLSMRMGKFVSKEVEAVSGNKRLTHEIVLDVIELASDRKHVMFFATSLEHADEIASSLPSEQTIVISSKMKSKDRRTAIANIKRGMYRYIVNRDILTVGFNFPELDCIAILRPSESRRLVVQIIGRMLRLSDGKNDGLLLDYAGNIERHGGLKKILTNSDIDGDISEGDGSDAEHGLICPDCGYDNKITAQKCNGCKEYYFTFKECDSCGVLNSISARHCRECNYELIDPNNGLERLPDGDIVFSSKVRDMMFTKHQAKSGRNMLRVDYYMIDAYNGNPILSEFFMLDGKGAYYLKNIYKYKEGDKYETPTIERFMADRDLFRLPEFLSYKRDGKFFKITKRG